MDFTYKYQTIDPYGRYSWAQKSFKTQKELFAYLVGEKDLVLSQKKSITKLAEGGLSAVFHNEEKEIFTTKAKPLYENNKDAGILKRTVLANTYWWMDSHSDVHLGRGSEEESAIFTESIKGRASKIFPIDQHNYSLDGRMGKTLNIYEAPISWRALGVGKTGMTEGLFADAQIEKRKNPSRYEDYLNDEVDQHSVGMRYIDIQLAVNDENEYPKEHAIYQKYISKIGNRASVEKQGFFFAVGKAHLGEYSAVIAGSNELTPTMGQGSGDTGKEVTGVNLDLLKATNKILNDLKLKEICQMYH
jgi:hypothetical protein